MIHTLAQHCNVVSLLAPAADAAGRTGAYASMKNVHRAHVIAFIKQGNAATVTVSLLQASAVAGTGSKAGPAVPIWSNQDAAADAFTRVAADAASFETSAALKDKIVIFDVDPAKLDINNGFDCIGVSTGASNAANITSVLLIAVNAYGQASPPSVLAD